MHVSIKIALGDHIATLNDLLQAEASALETYRQVCGPKLSQSWSPNLEKIAQNHERAVAILCYYMQNFGATPIIESDPNAENDLLVLATAQNLDTFPDLQALRQEEEVTATKYLMALSGELLSRECRQAIRQVLLPQIQQHLDELDLLIGEAPLPIPAIRV